MSKNKNITDERMLLLIDLLLESGRIRFKQEFLETVGVARQNINSIKNGLQHFTVEHLFLAGKSFNVNMNWLFGFQNENPFFSPSNKNSNKEPLKNRIINVSE